MQSLLSTESTGSTQISDMFLTSCNKLKHGRSKLMLHARKINAKKMNWVLKAKCC
jgi:hypothetical protein